MISLRFWFHRLCFVVLAMAVLLVQLLPLETGATAFWAGLDLTLLFAMAWSVRQPQFVPALLLASVFLIEDLLLQRPPGLWALLSLLGCAHLKAHAPGLRDAGLLRECLTVAGLIVAIHILNRFVLGILMLDQPSIVLYAIQMVSTIFAYPVVIVMTQTVFGVRKPVPVEFGAKGSRS